MDSVCVLSDVYRGTKATESSEGGNDHANGRGMDTGEGRKEDEMAADDPGSVSSIL